MAVIGPDFVALQVRDLEASTRFYTERLGLTRAPAAPPGAVVFATEPIPFAIREPAVDLDATNRLGWGVALWLKADDVDKTARRPGRPRRPHRDRAVRRPVRPDVCLRRPGRLRRHPAQLSPAWRCSRWPREGRSRWRPAPGSWRVSPRPGTPGRRISPLELAFPVEGELDRRAGVRVRETSAWGDRRDPQPGRPVPGAGPRRSRTRWPGFCPWTWTGPASPRWGARTRWWPGCSAATRGCGRSASGRPMRRRPGPSSASASASGRPPRSRPGWPRNWGSRSRSAATPCHAFPAPQRLVTLADGFGGLSGRKPEWLPVAGPGHPGRPARHRAACAPSRTEEALAGLTQLPGIGPFAAELVLLRGAGQLDRIPRHETRLARAVALAYRLPEPAVRRRLHKLSENWRPYRTWVTLLLRAQLEDETGEISAPEYLTPDRAIPGNENPAQRSQNVRRLLFPVRRLHGHQPGDQDLPPVLRPLVRPAPRRRRLPDPHLLQADGDRRHPPSVGLGGHPSAPARSPANAVGCRWFALTSVV